MKLDISLNVHVAPNAETAQWMERVLGILTTLRRDVTKMSEQMDKMTTEVSEAKTVMEGAAVLLGTLSQQIRDLKDDPAKLEALAAELDASSNALGEAIAANTPAAEPPAEPTEPA